MKYLLILLLLCTSCSVFKPTANDFARRSRKNWEKAVRMDPSLVNRDTSWISKDTTVQLPGTRIDTLVDVRTDTITIVKDNVTVKTVYVPKINKQYIYVDKKPDTVRIPYEVPVIKEKIVEKWSLPWWTTPLGIVIGAFVLIVIILRTLRRIGIL